jgi:hypothetical protein
MPIAIKSTGGGSVTLTAPSTASDLTLTLPSATGTVATTGSPTFTGDVTFSGTGIWNSSGNVGIGTSSPGTRLDAYTSGTTSTVLRTRNDTTTVYLDANNGYSYLNTFTNHPMLFGTNNIERGRFDTSGNFQFNSGYGSVAVAYGCRAWVNYNTTAPSVRASGNVSSITKNSTANYTVNFSTAMVDSSYAITAVANTYNTYQALDASIQTQGTTSFDIRTGVGNSASAAEGTELRQQRSDPKEHGIKPEKPKLLDEFEKMVIKSFKEKERTNTSPNTTEDQDSTIEALKGFKTSQASSIKDKKKSEKKKKGMDFLTQEQLTMREK